MLSSPASAAIAGMLSHNGHSNNHQQQSNGVLNNNHCASNNFHSSAVKSNYKMSNPNELSDSQKAKRFAAYACGEAEVRDGMCLGVGSGTTIKFLIDWLYEKCSNGQLKNIRCVPTSYQTRQWLYEAQMPVCSLDELNELDLTIDGADEVDHKLNCIKGGGGCLMQEKIVQTCAKRFTLIGGRDKYSESLGQAYQSIPIEIAPFGCAPIKRWICEKFGGECVLRMDAKNCFPSITENHNFIVDWHFPKPIPSQDKNWLTKVNQGLLSIPGVAETGLFLGVADAGYFGTKDGDVFFAIPGGQLQKIAPKK